jgi:proteasome lid subunit RPN8/RPN11
MRFSPLIALACTATLSCETDSEEWRRSNLARGWAESSYRLPYHEGVRFSREARAARQNGNREVCGAILRRSDDDGTLELVFADNESRHAHSYELSPRSVKRIRGIAHARKARIIGAFHSHPTSDATPGNNDLTHAGVHSLLLIHSVPTGQTRLWQVVLRDGAKKAREIQLDVIGRRLRGPSPLAPSPGRSLPDGEELHDLRTR